MNTPRCFVCGTDWDRVHPCRLSAADDPDDWTAVDICTACWRAAERRHQARLRAHEHRLLATWPLALPTAAAGDERTR